MKNLNHLTAKELINYLDFTSTDPLVRKLIELLGEDNLRADLEYAGMDPVDCTFRDDGYTYHSPSEYINQLRNDIEYHQREADDWERQCERAIQECERLKARSIAEFLQDVEKEKLESQRLVKDAMKTVHAYKTENSKLKEQIDMWGIMNRTT